MGGLVGAACARAQGRDATLDSGQKVGGANQSTCTIRKELQRLIVGRFPLPTCG